MAATGGASLQGSVVLIPMPSRRPLGVVLTFDQELSPYPMVETINEGSPLEGQIKKGDSMMSVGTRNLLNVSAGDVGPMLANTFGNIVVLRPNINPLADGGATAVQTPSNLGKRQRTPSSNSANNEEQKQQKQKRVVTVKKEPNTNFTRGNTKSPECIELLSSSDDDDDDDDDEKMEDAGTAKDSNKKQSAQAQVVTKKIGKPTLFASGQAHFPNTIDTGFSGNMVNPSLKLRFKEIDSLQRYSTTMTDLPLIWPSETPVPCEGGGFYESLYYYSNKGLRPRPKAGRKTQSRVARLAGQISIDVHICNQEVATACKGQRGQQESVNNFDFVMAETLWGAIQRSGDPNSIVSPENQQLLRAIANLNDRNHIFKERCLFVVAEAIQPTASNVRPSVARLHFQVYFRRALFGLAANPNIKHLLDALQPLPKQDPWIPCRRSPPSTNQYQQSQRPTTHGFNHSLPGILWANESTGYPLSGPTAAAATSFRGVKVTLRDYQKESVAWMQSQENANAKETGGGVAGLNGYFWERRTFVDGEKYYYFPFGGQILMNSPPVVTGGLLAEEMGLGKTVITLELICSDAKDVPASRGGTLVVLPVSLLAQWEEELNSKAPHLKVLTYHGDGVSNFHKDHRGELKENLAKFDVVLTTMSKLKELTASRNRGNQTTRLTNNCLTKVEWHRLVVDECQFLKNDTTAIARAASAITAKHIWMLSGTPLTNKLDDLRGELSLLRVWPFTLGTSSDEGWRDWFWSEYCKKPWDARSGEALPVIHNLMQAVSMRHSRLQIRSNGSPLVVLPPRTEKFVLITMDSRSSYAYVIRWVEALAVQLLCGFNRFDVRVTGLVTKLRQLTSSPKILLDQQSLQQLDDALTEIANFEAADANLGIRKVALVQAIKDRKQQQDSPVLQELMLVAANGPGCLAQCIYCKKPRSRPAYLSCDHSLCVACCDELLKFRGAFNCPVCKKEARVDDIIQVLVPEQLLSLSASRASSRCKGGAIEIDLDEAHIDQILVDNNLQPKTQEKDSQAATVNAVTTYDLSHEEDFDFERRSIDSGRQLVTFEYLEKHPKPHLVAQPDLRTKEVLASLANLADLKAVVNHATACSAELHACPKIKALCDTIQSIREASLEAKICVFSTYAQVLDHVEDALDNVRYTVEYDMNRNMILLPGQRVKCLPAGQIAHVVRRTENSSYEVKTLKGRTLTANRNALQVEPLVVANVPSKYVRRDKNDTGKEDQKLSVNGSDDRHAIGSRVESKRPLCAELQFGYPVTILSVVDAEGHHQTGRVVFVHRNGNGQHVSYDVQPDAYVATAGGDHSRMDVMKHVPPDQLQDKGGGNRWMSAKIVGVATKQRLGDAAFSTTSNQADPFENALGYVRLDGSSGNASRRGQILEIFKRDPMCSVCLVTKESAGVGLNLTDANHCIVLEPSMDAHDELQSIARIHRIGQTRKVSVYKFFMKDSLEERILLRRQQRGELSVSINSMTGGAAEEEEDSAEEKDSSTLEGKASTEVSSSRAITFADLKLLLGQPTAGTMVDLASTEDNDDEGNASKKGNPSVRSARKNNGGGKLKPAKLSFEEILLETWNAGDSADVTDLMKALTAQNCNHQTREDKWTPLMILSGLAAVKGTPSAIRQAITLGANPAVKDEDGWTALHWAAFHGSPQAAKELVKKDLTLLQVKDVKGMTPMQTAKKENNVAVIKVLEEAEKYHS